MGRLFINSMKHIFLLLFFFSFYLATAQDTLYYNKEWQEVPQGEATYYTVDQRPGEDGNDLSRKTYWINGQIYRERSFTEKDEKLTLEGIQKTWYENGQLFYTENYRKGERHDELLAYWEDGSKRRHDIFKKGKLKSGRTWDREGKEIEHFPVMVPAMFPGGQQALQAYLKDNIPHNPKQPNNTTVHLVVSLRVTKEGKVEILKILDEAPHWYIAVTINTLTNMPRWKPGTFMGEPINVIYALPVTFRK